MAAIDRTNYKRIQRSYYNVNIYNDTNDVIECKYSANMIVPLLDKPNQYEVSVVRASVPLDGIPISQVNIGFESWQVQFTNTQTNQTSNAYVQQFNPNIETYNESTAIIGLLNSNLQTLTLPEPEPTFQPPLNLTPYSTAVSQGVISGNNSNISYSLTYINVVSNYTQIRSYIYGSNIVSNTITITDHTSNTVIRGVCSSQGSDILYVLTSKPDGSEMTLLYYPNLTAIPIDVNIGIMMTIPPQKLL